MAAGGERGMKGVTVIWNGVIVTSVVLFLTSFAVFLVSHSRPSQISRAGHCQAYMLLRAACGAAGIPTSSTCNLSFPSLTTLSTLTGRASPRCRPPAPQPHLSNDLLHQLITEEVVLQNDISVWASLVIDEFPWHVFTGTMTGNIRRVTFLTAVI
jgi:hypothetical protein